MRESLGSSVVHATTAPDAEIDDVTIPESAGGVVSFDAVTLTAAAVDVLPAASRATAVSVWLPLAAAVVSHVTAYGALVTSTPRLTPSTLNCTPATPTLSEALATICTAPDTDALAAGAVSDTDGAVPSSVVNAKSLE